MKISLNWIKNYVTIGISPEKLANKLTMAGHEVEKVFSSNGDTVFEMEITPNRSDCLCMLGMAREIAAILGKTRRFPKTKRRTWPRAKYPIAISDKQGCSRYIGVVIEGVSIKQASEDIAGKLKALDLRPINNVVDVTNFCLMETGQPMHAFDRDKLTGGKIIVRRARKGEKIVTIDDVERELDPSILVIADEQKPVAIAGIMGGKNTEVTAQTKNILLESAYFDPVLIRRASRKLGLGSDSSYRFERGVDYPTVELGANRAVDLILEKAGGKVVQRADVVVSGKKKATNKIMITSDRIAQLIGAPVTTAQSRAILKRLDFGVTGGDGKALKIVPPSFRGDVKAEEDIVEEISRIIGYENIPRTFPWIKTADILSDGTWNARKRARDILLSQGCDEAISYTMISRKHLEMSRLADLPAVEIFNPLTQDQEIMRPSLLPCFLGIILSNVNKGQKNLKFFETGKIYTAQGEREVIGLAMTGMRADDWRQTSKESADYYDLKGTLQAVFLGMGIGAEALEFQSVQQGIFEEGQSSNILMNGKMIGFAGKIDKTILDRWDIKQKDILFAQVDLQDIYRKKRTPTKYAPIPEFPAIARDISLAVPKKVRARDIENALRASIGQQKEVVLSEIKFVEKYEGEKVSKGFRGLVFSLTYRAQSNRTLRDEEVAEVHERACDALVQGLGVTRR